MIALATKNFEISSELRKDISTSLRLCLRMRFIAVAIRRASIIRPGSLDTRRDRTELQKKLSQRKFLSQRSLINSKIATSRGRKESKSSAMARRIVRLNRRVRLACVERRVATISSIQGRGKDDCAAGWRVIEVAKTGGEFYEIILLPALTLRPQDKACPGREKHSPSAHRVRSLEQTEGSIGAQSLRQSSRACRRRRRHL